MLITGTDSAERRGVNFTSVANRHSPPRSAPAQSQEMLEDTSDYDDEELDAMEYYEEQQVSAVEGVKEGNDLGSSAEYRMGNSKGTLQKQLSIQTVPGFGFSLLPAPAERRANVESHADWKQQFGLVPRVPVNPR